MAATEAARLTAYREGVAIDAWDAGRGLGSRGGLRETFEFVRERKGILGATGARTEETVQGDYLNMGTVGAI